MKSLTLLLLSALLIISVESQWDVKSNVQNSVNQDNNNVQIQTRIVGGRVARKNEVPYQVGLRTKGSTETFGGGVIIGKNWVLTAGHCVRNSKNEEANPPEKLELVLGGRNRKDVKGPPFVAHVVKTIPFPRYDPRKNGDWDIALIKTKENIIVNQDGFESKAALIPSQDQNFSGKTAVASGYGGIRDGGPQSDDVKVANLKIWDPKQCKEKNGNFIAKSHICAASTMAEGVCGGDSGGPLAIVNNGQATVVGVSSYLLAKCGTANFPGFFSNVAGYSDWIKKTMASN